MFRNFFSTPNVIGRLILVLLFVGGIVFAGGFNGFVVETNAKSCCGSETDTSVLSGSSCCGATEAAEVRCIRKSSGSNQKYCKLTNGKKCNKDCSGPGDRGSCKIAGC